MKYKIILITDYYDKLKIILYVIFCIILFIWTYSFKLACYIFPFIFLLIPFAIFIIVSIVNVFVYYSIRNKYKKLSSNVAFKFYYIYLDFIEKQHSESIIIKGNPKIRIKFQLYQVYIFIYFKKNFLKYNSKNKIVLIKDIIKKYLNAKEVIYNNSKIRFRVNYQGIKSINGIKDLRSIIINQASIIMEELEHYM